MKGVLPWTQSRATGWGILAGLAALALWPVYATAQGVLIYVFTLALIVTALCGLSLLVMTLIDIRNRQRGIRMRAFRIFDVVAGLLLALPSLMALRALFG